MRIPLQGVRVAEVRLHSGAGRLELGSLNPDSPNLIESEIGLLPGERLERGVETAPGGLRASLRSQGWISGLARRTEGWKSNLAPALNLSVESGVRVELPGRGRYSARIKGGVGQLEVQVPEELGLRLVAKVGLGGVETPSELVTRDEGQYESENYARAQDRVDLEVDGGVERVVIQRWKQSGSRVESYPTTALVRTD